MSDDKVFPEIPLIDHVGSPVDSGGLTKRELFAAMCLQGLCSNPYFIERVMKRRNPASEERRMVVETAMLTADALLERIAEK